MIRTRCPHCNKLLGIVDSAAGKVTTCPGCKQKFRAPAAKPPAAADFPEVELVEDEEATLDEDVAARDDGDEEAAPVRGADRKKKKKKGKAAREDKAANMAIRNRIMGAVGAAAGLGLMVFGIMNQEILNVTAQAKALNPSLETVPRIATIGFGALLVLVGGYYLIIDMLRGE